MRKQRSAFIKPPPRPPSALTLGSGLAGGAAGLPSGSGSSALARQFDVVAGGSGGSSAGATAGTSGSGGGGGGGDGLREVPLKELVGCLVAIDGLPKAKTLLNLHTRPSVSNNRNIMDAGRVNVC